MRRTITAIRGRARARWCSPACARRSATSACSSAPMSLVDLALSIATGLALWLIGVPNPVLWGTTTGPVQRSFPYLGPLLITLLLLLAGSVTFGTGAAMLGPPAAFLVLHGLEANYMSPMIMGHRPRRAPYSCSSVMTWGWLSGRGGGLPGRAVAPRAARGLQAPAACASSASTWKTTGPCGIPSRVIAATRSATDSTHWGGVLFRFGMRLPSADGCLFAPDAHRLRHRNQPPELNGVSLTVDAPSASCAPAATSWSCPSAPARRSCARCRRRTADPGCAILVYRGSLRPGARRYAGASLPEPRPEISTGDAGADGVGGARRGRALGIATTSDSDQFHRYSRSYGSGFSPARCSACCAASTT